MKVGVWIRVSTDEQAQGDSPEHHRKRAEQYAEFNHWEILEVYDLSGVSGKTVLDHPEAQRMLHDIREGRIEGLIFSKLARLARNVRELIEISEIFEKYHAALISLEEKIDTSSPAGRLLFVVIGALAQWEREEISARVAASVPIRAKLGKQIGGQGPFGYRWVQEHENEQKRLLPNFEEAPAVREIYSIFRREKKYLTVVKIMNGRGFRTRKGQEFTRTSIKRILTDPIYKGTRRANYSQSKGNKKSWVLKPEKQWVYVPVDPIIPVKDWEEVQTIIAQIEKKYPGEPLFLGKYKFGGRVVCQCGEKMYVAKYSGMKVPRYRCRSCHLKINEDVLIQELREGLHQIVINPDQLAGSMLSDDTVIQQKTAELKAAQRELSSVERKTSDLLDLHSNRSVDKPTFTDRMSAPTAQRDQLHERIPRLEAEIDYAEIQKVGKAHVVTQAAHLGALWDDMTEDDQAKTIKEIVKRVIIGKDSINIELFYLPEVMLLDKSDRTSKDSWPRRA
jgi:site-specific DNA recombinase